MKQAHTDEARDQAGSAWRQVAAGLLGGAIVVVTVLGSIMLAMQEALPAAPLPETSAPSATSPIIDVTSPPSATPVPSLTSGPATAPPTLAPTACSVPPGWTAYTVRAGDSLASIAATAGTSVFDLIEGNCLVETELAAGQLIYIPPPPTRGPTAVPTRCGPPRSWVIYYVQAGDTLYALSVRYQTSVHALALANCLTTDQLRVGQPLYVPPIALPSITPSATHSPSPLPSDTAEASATPSNTPGPTDTLTPFPSDTPTPTWTPQPTDTLLPSDTPRPSPTGTPPMLDTPVAPPTRLP